MGGKYYIDIVGNDANTASDKAPRDVSAIIKGMGYKRIRFMTMPKFENDFLTAFIGGIVCICNWILLPLRVKSHSFLVIQYTMGVSRIAYVIGKVLHIKKIKICILIHDINSIRNLEKNDMSDKKERLIKEADVIICHNEKMKKWLCENMGIDEKIMVPLGIFDYLADDENITENNKDNIIDNSGELKNEGSANSVLIAGNLNPKKSPYIDKLQTVQKTYELRLYGPNYDSNPKAVNTIYKGVYKAEELLDRLDGAWGIVWDGEELDTCSGSTGRYLRFNNPHKLSLYIAAGLPVIIWDEAACADYIKSTGVGICVKSLGDIEDKIKSISSYEYQEIVKNVAIEAGKLRCGYYTNRAIKASESICKTE